MATYTNTRTQIDVGGDGDGDTPDTHISERFSTHTRAHKQDRVIGTGTDTIDSVADEKLCARSPLTWLCPDVRACVCAKMFVVS